MKITLKKAILFSGIALCSSCSNVYVAPIWEISDPDLDEIAMIRADPNWATVVIYNPVTCKQIGEACGFFRLHAFAHEKLRHGLLGEPDDYPRSQENAADCYAAKYGKPNETYAAYKLFLNKDKSSEWKIHGDPVQRAETVKNCAVETKNWS